MRETSVRGRRNAFSLCFEGVRHAQDIGPQRTPRSWLRLLPAPKIDVMDCAANWPPVRVSPVPPRTMRVEEKIPPPDRASQPKNPLDAEVGCTESICSCFRRITRLQGQRRCQRLLTGLICVRRTLLRASLTRQTGGPQTMKNPARQGRTGGIRSGGS